MISSSENRMEEWKRYVERLEREGLLRDVIVESWRRCVNGTAASPADPVSYCRVSDEELQLRLQANAELISVAKPHLDWIAAPTAGACGVLDVEADHRIPVGLQYARERPRGIG